MTETFSNTFIGIVQLTVQPIVQPMSSFIFKQDVHDIIQHKTDKQFCV